MHAQVCTLLLNVLAQLVQEISLLMGELAGWGSGGRGTRCAAAWRGAVDHVPGTRAFDWALQLSAVSQVVTEDTLQALLLSHCTVAGCWWSRYS